MITGRYCGFRPEGGFGLGLIGPVRFIRPAKENPKIRKIEKGPSANWAGAAWLGPARTDMARLSGAAEGRRKQRRPAGLLAAGVRRWLGLDAMACRGRSGRGRADGGDEVAGLPLARRRGFTGAAAELGMHGEWR